MPTHMRTTVHLDDGLLEQAKREAARRHQTLRTLIEQGLRADTAKTGKTADVPRWRRGAPGIDLNDGTDLLDVMEARR